MSASPQNVSIFIPPRSDLSPHDVKVAVVVCFAAWTIAVYDFVLFGNLLPVIAEELGWAEAASTRINTIITLGTALVAFAIGPLSDRVGRKRGIIIAVVGAGAASAATALGGWAAGVSAGLGVVWFIVIRSIAGLGYAEQAVNAAYLNEIFVIGYSDPAQAKRRGFVYSLVQSGWPVGAVLAAVSVYVLFPIGGWQLCFVVAGVPSVLLAIAARWLRESPQFEHHRHLQRLRDAGHHAHARSYAAEHGLEADRTGPASIADVFRGPSLRSTAFIGGAFLLNWVGVLSFSILGTSLLTAESGKDIEFSNALVILIVSNATAFVGYLFHGWLGDRIGRRNAIGIGWLLCAASFFAMLLAPSGAFGVIIALYSAGLFFMIGPFAALLFFTGESYPSATRGTGSALINAAGQVGAIVGGVLVTAGLSAGWSWTTTTMWFGALPVLLSGLLIFGARHVDPREVRHG